MEFETLEKDSAAPGFNGGFPTWVNVNTTYFPEQWRGLMLCGINWGGDPDDTSGPPRKSFFSDAASFNAQTRYRNKIVEWFKLWGQPLETSQDQAGVFERSIVQTNWMDSQSKRVEGDNVAAQCVGQWSNFEKHVRYFSPRLIIFLGISLLDAMKQCNAESSLLFGANPNGIVSRVCDKVMTDSNKPSKKFRYAHGKLGDTAMIWLPHPTGSHGLTNNYIKAFSDEISPIITEYRNALR